jgi:signal transduction histidine kinase
MQKRLAENARAITIPSPETLPGLEGAAMPTRSPRTAGRGTRAGSVRPVGRSTSTPPAKVSTPPATASKSAVADETFYRDLVWNLRNGVLAVTRDGRIAVMNEVAYHILGLKPRTTDIGLPFIAVLKDRPDVARIVAGAFELSHLPNRAELRVKSTGKVIGYTLSQVRDARGRITGATLFFKDLTRVEQLEERERLRDRLAALGEMAAAIAHEVKNPLAGIEVMAGLLKRQLPESEDAQNILRDIIKEAKMANAIVLEVLDFVRPVRLHVDPVHVGTLLGDALLMAESQVPRGGVVVSVDVPEQDLPEIHGDDHQLRQVFTNLLINAFEALNGEGRVQVRVRVLDARVQIDIEDNGPGIPEAIRDRVFSPFFTTKPRGSGLGLAIVRKIVDAHEGRIEWRTGADGIGSCLRLVLPVHPSADTSPLPACDEGAPGGPRAR